MQIGTYGVPSQSLWDVYNSASSQALSPDAVTGRESGTHQTTSGDSVSISKEALALYSSTYNAQAPAESGQPVSAPPVSGEEGSIERQIQALQNQIASLTSLVGTDSGDSRVHSEISSLQAQVLTLQAQLM